jgi:MFS family permease
MRVGDMNLVRSFLLRNYSALKGPVKTLAFLHFFDSVGGGLFITSSAVYFVIVSHISLAQVGLGISLAGVSGFGASVLMGLAADRLPTRQLLLFCMLGLAAAYCVYPAVHSAPTFFCVIVFVGALEWGSAPLFHMSIMDLVPEEDRVNARASLRSLFNVGFSCGALLAAVFISLGGTAMQFIPLGNASSFLLAAGMAWRLPKTSPPRSPSKRTSRFRALRDISFLSVVGTSSLLALHGAVLAVGIPLWLLKYHIVPRNLIPLIFVLNTTLVVLLQVKVARGAKTLDGSVTAARKAGLLSTAACLTLFAGSFTAVPVVSAIALVGVLLFTFAELLQSSSVFGLSFGLAPDSARGEYLGAFHLHKVISATVGPAAAAFLVVEHGSFGWFIMGLIFLTGTAAIGPAVNWARKDKVALCQGPRSAAGSGLTSAGRREAVG